MKRSERLMFLAGVLFLLLLFKLGQTRRLRCDLWSGPDERTERKDKKQRCGHSYHPGGHSDSSLLGDGNGESLIS